MWYMKNTSNGDRNGSDNDRTNTIHSQNEEIEEGRVGTGEDGSLPGPRTED